MVNNGKYNFAFQDTEGPDLEEKYSVINVSNGSPKETNGEITRENELNTSENIKNGSVNRIHAAQNGNENSKNGVENGVTFISNGGLNSTTTSTVSVQLDQQNGHGKKGNSNQPEKSKSRLGISELNSFLIRKLESFFYFHGKRVAAHPLITILLCLVLSGLCATGIFFFSVELRPFKLWIPQNSNFIKLLEWQNDNFPVNYRQHSIYWESDNVLTPEAIQQMWRVHQLVEKTVEPTSGKSWIDLCNRLPSFNIGAEEEETDDDWELGTLQFRRRKRDVADDISIAVSRSTYCSIIDTMPHFCHENGLLELWGYRDDVIMNLTEEKIIKDLNAAVISEVFGYTLNISDYLGGIERNEKGDIVSARAAKQTWVTVINDSAIAEGFYEVDTGSGQKVDKSNMEWEKVWLQIVLDTSEQPESIKSYANAAGSFGRVSDENIYGDVTLLTVGLILMLIFVNSTLGRRNLVQQRPMLTTFGTSSVVLAVFASYGICSYLGISYNPVNSILPLLLLGLGVDDMFIIVSIWDSIKKDTRRSNNNGITEETQEELEERAGKTMRHAGVAITATSLTDVTAFAIGATTDLPALRSFCLFASFGILIVFLLQSSYFVAFLVLDQQRMNKNRNGLFWCYEHKDWKPSSCSKVDLLDKLFLWYSELIVKDAVRVAVLAGSAILVVLASVGICFVRQEFNPLWFIPRTSYLGDFFAAKEAYWADDGAHSFILFNNESMGDHIESHNKLAQDLAKLDSVAEVDNWVNLLGKYVTANPDFIEKNLTDSLVSNSISLFLDSPTGAKFKSDVIFQNLTSCADSAPPIKYFRLPFKHRPVDLTVHQQRARHEIYGLLEGSNIPGVIGVWSEVYITWETNEIVAFELIRNMALAGLVIGIMTVILLVSIRAAGMVLCCVTATVAGVGGSMYLSGLTLDTVSCISLVLSIGLAVDYSMHIAHSFLTQRTEICKKRRSALALQKVGPAVLQGGLSTLIPFVILAFSNSHVFWTFYGIFTPTTILGLFHALVMLPVMLSFFGPEPYDNSHHENEGRQINGNSSSEQNTGNNVVP